MVTSYSSNRTRIQLCRAQQAMPGSWVLIQRTTRKGKEVSGSNLSLYKVVLYLGVENWKNGKSGSGETAGQLLVTEIRDDSGSDNPATCGSGWTGEVCGGETDRVLGAGEGRV